MVRISSSSCSVRDNRQWYNNSGNYQGSNQYVRWKPNGEYSVENIIIYVGGGWRVDPNGSYRVGVSLSAHF